MSAIAIARHLQHSDQLRAAVLEVLYLFEQTDEERDDITPISAADLVDYLGDWAEGARQLIKSEHLATKGNA